MLSKNDIQLIRSLADKKNRVQHGLFIAEGSKIVEEVIQSDYIIHKLFCVDDFYPHIPTNLIEKTQIISESFMSRITQLQTPSTVLALVKMKHNSLNSLPPNTWKILCDGIQDPGNLGTIIRTADWFGVHELICSEDTVDVFNTKVIQASMGSFTRVKCLYTSLESFLQSNKQLPVYGALLQGKPIQQYQQAKPGLIIVGHEGKGIRTNILPYIQEAIHIPRVGNAESLNVSIATGIILHRLIQ